MAGLADNPWKGPMFGDIQTGRGRARPMTDSRGNKYRKIVMGKKKKGG